MAKSRINILTKKWIEIYEPNNGILLFEKYLRENRFLIVITFRNESYGEKLVVENIVFFYFPIITQIIGNRHHVQEWSYLSSINTCGQQ